MVPIKHLNTSQAEAPLIQHLNQTETPPNHGDLSQAEAPVILLRDCTILI